jgi:hypothetical protein
MYLARYTLHGQSRFAIRQTLEREGRFVSRELFDLGADPEEYIVYPGGNAFYIDDRIKDVLSGQGVDPDNDALESIFWPFLDGRIRHALRGFRNRGRGKARRSRVSPEEIRFIRDRLHVVDKRRLNYLRIGHLDQTQMNEIPDVFYRQLVFKSRDELEQHFMGLEQELPPRELSSYVYSFLNLRRFFSEIYAGKMPQGLDEDKLERFFIQTVCDLNADPAFWGPELPGDRLHPYLIRYVIMFFDYPFAPSTFLQDMLNEYVSRRQRRSQQIWQEKTGGMREASRAFDVSEQELRSMDRAEVTRLYRQKIQKLHPDKGGEHEDFIRLTRAYKAVLLQKPSS